MTFRPASDEQLIDDSRSSTIPSALPAGVRVADMLTLKVRLNVAGQELALGLPRSEWLKLISDFERMPADERQRMSVSVRDSVAQSPFPVDGHALSPREQRRCDIFVNDCILLAALAEAAGPRILLDTAVEEVSIAQGLPDLAALKGAMH